MRHGFLTAWIKPWIGRRLFQLCETFPRAKPWVRRWGLRSSKEWFRHRTAHVQRPGGRTLRLASVGENYLSFELFWRGTAYYEPLSTFVAETLAASADVFVDAGANIGFYSLMLATRHPQLTVLAFEPNPRLYALLQANLTANRLTHTRCEPLALSDRETTAPLHLHPSDMSASLEPGFGRRHAGATPVRTIRLDHYLAQQAFRGRLLIKVDVEGHEPAFFRGARETIVRERPDFIAEVTSDYDPGIVGHLREHGYRFYSISDRGLVAMPQPVPVVRGPLAFLNYLLTTRSADDVEKLSHDTRQHAAGLDLRQTSKCADPRVLTRLRSS